MEKHGLAVKEYAYALRCSEKRISILYQTKQSKVNIGTYSTVIILSLCKSSINTHLAVGVKGMVNYVASYIWKSEQTMNKNCQKKSIKESIYVCKYVSKTHSIREVLFKKTGGLWQWNS